MRVGFILSCAGVSYRPVLDWMIGFIAPVTFTQVGTTGNYSAVAILRAIQLTVPHSVWFSIFISHILAMGLSVSL
jgi:hypothetical protein